MRRGRGHRGRARPGAGTRRRRRPNHFARISRAAGAAASAPKPPSSTVTTTTIGRDGSSTQARVPRLVGVGRALGGARLAVHGVREAGEDVGRRAAGLRRRGEQARRGSPRASSGSKSIRALRRLADLLELAPRAVLDLQAEVRRDDAAAVGERRVGDGRAAAAWPAGRPGRRTRLTLSPPLQGRSMPPQANSAVGVPRPTLPSSRTSGTRRSSLSRHSASGTRPPYSPGRSMPVGLPKLELARPVLDAPAPRVVQARAPSW